MCTLMNICGGIIMVTFTAGIVLCCVAIAYGYYQLYKALWGKTK